MLINDILIKKESFIKRLLFLCFVVFSGYWIAKGEADFFKSEFGTNILFEYRKHLYSLFAVLYLFFILKIKKTNISKTRSKGGLNNLTWSEFEELTQELFKKRGFNSQLVGGSGGDGGVDVKLKRGKKIWIVQCKHWKTKKVGINVIREMYGASMHLKADGAKIVTSGEFTSGCYDFVKGKEIELITGRDLIKMIK